jgi:hypothetical protein
MELFWTLIFVTIGCGVGLELLLGPFTKGKYFETSILFIILALLGKFLLYLFAR